MNLKIVSVIALGVAQSGLYPGICAADEIKKEGLNVGVLPAISFDADLGFQYGVLSNFYIYGKDYPQFDHSLYLEASRYTLGSQILRLNYSSDKLIKNVNLNYDLSYITNQTETFYGFNGRGAVYSKLLEEQETSVFYKTDRKQFQTRLDLTFPFFIEHLNWYAGFAYYNTKIGNVDIDKLNKNKSDHDKISANKTLFEYYKTWGIITPNEQNGSEILYLKGGITYDSRDKKSAPNKGVWADLVFYTDPGLTNNSFAHSKLSATYRQYFPVITDKCVVAFRAHYQDLLSGTEPFYAMNLFNTTLLRSATSQGLGGFNTIRGVFRNRITGHGFVLSNLELRYKFTTFQLMKQNFYIGTNLFVDGGKVTHAATVDKTNVTIPAGFSQYNTNPETLFFSGEKDVWHSSAGIGFKIAMNQNFIVSADYGKPLSKDDGDGGLYIGLNYLF